MFFAAERSLRACVRAQCVVVHSVTPVHGCQLRSKRWELANWRSRKVDLTSHQSFHRTPIYSLIASFYARHNTQFTVDRNLARSAGRSSDPCIAMTPGLPNHSTQDLRRGTSVPR